jgi:hypothetical protein
MGRFRILCDDCPSIFDYNLLIKSKMKKIIISAILSLIILSSNVYANNPEIIAGGDKTNTAYNVDKLSAQVVNNKVYFNVTVNYETEKCIYSLVRFNPDGTIESIGLKDGCTNLNNLPLLYSFKDNEAPKEDLEYVLYRIGSDSKVIGKFIFNAKTESIALADFDIDISENTE